jgi:hypothetical protein
MSQTASKMNEGRLNTMKTTDTIFPTLNRLPLPPSSLEGVQWKVGSGEAGWDSSKPGIVHAAISAAYSVTTRLCVLSLRLSLALLRTLGLLVLAVFAVADAILTRIVAVPTAVAMAHGRAAWLHRWSRVARWVLGVRLGQRGVMPSSGIITANYSCFLDAILLASVRPCVFVAGAEVRRWPVIGLLARLGGTLFLDPRRHNDVARVNFLIERAVRRRLLVVIFTDCSGAGPTAPRPFASALFQPAVDLGCSLTGAAFIYDTLPDGEHPRMGITRERGLLRQFARIVSRWRTRAIGGFCRPAFHHGNRKQLADQLLSETHDLLLRIATPDGGMRKSASKTGTSKRVHRPVIAEGVYSKPEAQTEDAEISTLLRAMNR